MLECRKQLDRGDAEAQGKRRRREPQRPDTITGSGGPGSEAEVQREQPGSDQHVIRHLYVLRENAETYAQRRHAVAP